MAYLIADNCITSLGFNTDEHIKALELKKTGITGKSPMTDAPVANIDEPRFVEKVATANIENYSRFEQLLILSIEDTKAGLPADFAWHDSLLILASTKGNINLLAETSDPDSISLFCSAKRIADHFGLKQKPLVISNACISGLLALIQAQRLIDSGKQKNILVCGADLLSDFTVSGFNAFKSLSPIPCKPFDISRVGLSIGDGAASAMISDSPLKNREEIRLVRGASANDANHISGPSRTGEGLFKAIKRTLKNGEKPDFISSHGTATPYNDDMESVAFSRAGFSDIPVNSLKGFFGHTLGAAGILETVLSAKSLINNIVYPTLGCENIGVKEQINVVQNSVEIPLKKCLKTSSGFGGSNAALLIEKVETEEKPENFSFNKKYVVAKAAISNGKVFVDDKIVFQNEEADFKSASRPLFKNLAIQYPKYYKMDRISKLGFLCSEYLLKNIEIEDYEKESVSMIFSNSNSTLETDLEYQESLSSIPSPAVFVYTLPNIVQGEIAIRNRFNGENLFLINKTFDANLISQQHDLLFAQGQTSYCLMGWVEYNSPTDYHAMLFLTSEKKIENSTIFAAENFEEYYNKTK